MSSIMSFVRRYASPYIFLLSLSLQKYCFFRISSPHERSKVKNLTIEATVRRYSSCLLPTYFNEISPVLSSLAIIFSVRPILQTLYDRKIACLCHLSENTQLFCKWNYHCTTTDLLFYLVGFSSFAHVA